MPSTFDVIDNRFFHHKLKTNVVIGEQKIQGFGEVTIPAPAGVTFDFTTGLFNAVITIQQTGTPSLLTNTILPDKAINQGIITANVLVNGAVAVQGLQIPWEDIIDLPGLRFGDLVQKHDFQIEGFSFSPVLVAGALNLIIKAVFEYCVIAASERVIKVNAADIFCP